MTMKQLAHLAGVSVSTVSKAFSKSPEIPEARREQIFELAKKTGCYDKYCKPLFTKKVIGVICPEFQSDHFSQQLGYLKKEIEKRGSMMVATAYDFDAGTKEELITYFTENAKVDGLIIIGYDSSEKKYTTPIVVIGDSENSDSILLSTKSAIRDAIDYLSDNGHTNIAFIGEKLSKVKMKNFIEAMENKGLKINDDYIIEGNERFEEAGYTAMNNLLSMKIRPTAIIAAYDNIAIGAMRSIYEHGLKIPEDISIIGMDDNRSSSYTNVPLTSITLYIKDLCEIAVDLLFERIENGDNNKIKKIKVSTDLTKRQTVGKVKI